MPPGDRDPLAARLAQLEQRRAGTGTTSRTGARSGRSSRRHPAWIARIGAIGLSLASTGGLSAYFVHASDHAPRQAGQAAIVSAAATQPNPAGTAASTTAAVGPAAATTTPATTAPRAPTVVNGATFENQYGPVEVQATFGPTGRLVAADALQSPGGQGRSIAINQQAVPVLDTEATALQSAQVHTVSGATYTSTDYRRSLQSAIDTARAAAATTIS